MSFHKLMLDRPHYEVKKILKPHFEQPKIDVLIESLITNKSENYRKPQNNVDIGRKTSHQKNDSNQSQSVNIKKQSVQQAYNILSDFNDKQQIIASLKSLKSADQRVQLIDKILERRDEMMIAQLKLKAAKLEPIFNVICRKLKQQRYVIANRKKETMILLKKISDEQSPQTFELNKQIKRERQLKTLNMGEDNLMKKVQCEFTARLAFSWLANRHKNKISNFRQFYKNKVQLDNEVRERQFLRRSTALQFGKNTLSRLKQQFSKKISENSDQLIRQGFQKLEQKKNKNNYKNIQSKVNSGLIKRQMNLIPKVNTVKRQQALGLAISERQEKSIFRLIEDNKQQSLQ